MEDLEKVDQARPPKVDSLISPPKDTKVILLLVFRVGLSTPSRRKKNPCHIKNLGPLGP